MTQADRPARQRLSPAERRTQLETAAIEIVGRDGWSGATAESIARSAGVSKGLLWNYYTDIDHLMLEAARRALASLEAAVAADLDLDADVPGLLRCAIQRAALIPATHGAELRAIRQIALNLRPADGDAAFRDAEYRELHARQAALIRRGQQQGRLRADLDPHFFAVTYQGVVDTMLDYVDANPRVDPTEFANHVADVLLAGITVRQGLPPRPSPD